MCDGIIKDVPIEKGVINKLFRLKTFPTKDLG